MFQMGTLQGGEHVIRFPLPFAQILSISCRFLSTLSFNLNVALPLLLVPAASEFIIQYFDINSRDMSHCHVLPITVCCQFRCLFIPICSLHSRILSLHPKSFSQLFSGSCEFPCFSGIIVPSQQIKAGNTHMSDTFPSSSPSLYPT